MRQNESRARHNRMRRSKMRTLIKNVFSSTERSEAEKHLTPAISQIDKMANKGLVHPNNAARKKARLTRYVNSLS